jgi:archaellum biogenesis protein FlaJ (TadC family)
LSRTQSFDQLLLESIDDGLSILGNEPKQAVYHYLATIGSLDRERIPDKLDEFSTGLKKALGSASKVIERLILKNLFQRMGSTFRESSGLEFTDYVAEARRRFEISSTKYGDPLDSARSKKGQVSG